MKYFFIVALLALMVGCVLLLANTIVEDTPRQTWKEREADRRAQEFENIGAGLTYFQDKRTGLCFAYHWGGAGNGGPAMTLVPREKVEKYLINP